ncbi:MAG: acetyl-CoA carboxylase, carboxyltransferase subunit beta [Rhodospirillaceae bacterium]|nr:acetyl-CoA carboxylase, carboxyltransferase subunit beta [Rhodospirillaceae bacterium]
MNWLKDFVRPKLKELVSGGKETPENLWHQCPSCQQMIFHRDLEANIHVCQHCGHHLRIGVKKRLELLFDNGEYQTVELKTQVQDPLKFKDKKKYTDRLKEYQNKTGEKDALIIAHGKMSGMKVVIAAFNFDFMGGSMGIAVGEGIVTAARLAQVQDAALIIVPSSGGARMQEGALSLMQLPRTTIAVEEVKEQGLPYIVLLTDPTTGGVSASFAMLGDIQIAEPGCIIGFAGRRVIEQTIREELPNDFQKAEYLLEHGMIDMVVPRAELAETISRIISLLRNTGRTGDVIKINKNKKDDNQGTVAPIPHGARPVENNPPSVD